MADGSKIEWCDATWQPITGCSVVSPGCTNCYAMRLAGTRLREHPSRAGLTHDSKAGPVWTGEVRFNEQWLDQPLRWRKPRRIFVCAHGDLFHEAVPDEWIDRVFAVMALCPQHKFLVLTKRAKRMREYMTVPVRGAWAGRAHVIDDDGTKRPMTDVHFRMNAVMCDFYPKVPPRALNFAAKWADEHYPNGDGFMRRWPLPNVSLGVSVEDQPRADERIPELLATPAAVRFISAEPLLGPIDLNPWFRARRSKLRIVAVEAEGPGAAALAGALLGHAIATPARDNHAGLDWVIAGGESGLGARPCDLAWVRSLRDQCVDAGVPFFWKQHVENGRKIGLPILDGRQWAEFPK